MVAGVSFLEKHRPFPIRGHRGIREQLLESRLRKQAEQRESF
jgi:hypothetical protein